MGCQKKPETPLTLGGSGNHYVAMVTKLIASYFTAHLVESLIAAKTQLFLIQIG